MTVLRSLGLALLLAVLLLALAAGLTYAQDAGMMGADTADRVLQVVIGLGLAVYANFMPKQRARGRASVEAESWTQRALRVGGWSITLGALAYSALWAFAPLEVADTGSLIALGGATLFTLAHTVWCFTRCRVVRGVPTSR